MLVDGARHSLDLIHAEATHRGIRRNLLLDFGHVAEYCWTTEHPPGSREAETRAADKLTAVLAGHAERAASCSPTASTSQAPAGALPAPKPSFSSAH